jgi:hypothetical protein
MADKWTSSGTFNPMIDCAYIRNGGNNGNAEDFKVKITTTALTPLHTSLTGYGTQNDTPIHISVSNQGLGKDANKPIYTYLSNIGTENAKPIYVRTSMPITEFTANIALQIYSWSNSMTTDGKQSIGNARRAAQDAFVRAEEFVKQLMREKYIVNIDKTNGLVVWRTDINKIM